MKQLKASFKILFCLIILALLFSRCKKIITEEFIDFPDPAFLNALREEGVDQNGDGQISFNEAEIISTLVIRPSGISNLTGIEAFINLDTLRIYMNPLHNFDISNNTALRSLECIGCELSTLDISKNVNLLHLDCSGGAAMSNALISLDVSKNSMLKSLLCFENQLTSLDISNNLVLETLFCGRNHLSNLDLSKNLALTKLVCNNNFLTKLDISKNKALTEMVSCGNQLTSLDISKNIALVKIGIDNMPTLYQVCVWTIPFPPSDVEVWSDFSPNVYFSTQCNK